MFFYTDRCENRKPLIGRSSRNLPAPAWGSAMKAVFERSQNASRSAPAAAFGSIYLPSGVRQKKGPTVAPQMAPFTLVSSVFICLRRLGANKPNLAADAEPAAGDAGEAGPRRCSLVCSHTHTRLTYAKMQNSLSDSTRGETPGSHAEMKLMCLELWERK